MGEEKPGLAPLNTRWDRRFEDSDFWLWKVPARFLVDNIALFPRGRALDVASGPGRNAIFLARRGFTVDAVDISGVGHKMAQASIKEAGAEVEKKVNPIFADLGNYIIGPDTYELIINFYYLNRKLIDAMIGGLKDGGYLVFETFTKDHPGFRESSNPDHYLDRNELLGLVSPLDIVFYQEGRLLEERMQKGIARLIARKA